MSKFILLILTLTFAFGCVKDNKNQISVTPLRAAYTFEGGSGKIDVTSSIKWNATTDADWLTLSSVTSNAINYELSLNRSGNTRVATITISGGKESHQVLIEQAPPSNHPLRTFDSIALVTLSKQCNGKKWYLGHDTIPHPWDFALPITKWEGVVTGEIDGQLRVVALNLSGVDVIGELPENLTDLTELQMLLLRQNEITGNVISLCAKFPKLLYLDLSRNDFINYEDTPPAGSFGNLQYLYLSVCPIKGPIPDWALLPGLVELSVSSSQISGNIPAQIEQMSNLTLLDLSNNQFTGSIPPWITSLTKLTYLDISTCRLTGQIPSQIGNLRSLKTLKFANNDLSGGIASSIGSIINLEILNLSGNQLTTLPDQITNCSKLKHLDVSFNNIEGTLAPGWAAIKDLEYFIVLNNRMSGAIPDELLNDPRWSRNYWVPQSLICPQQKGYGFSNDPYK